MGASKMGLNKVCFQKPSFYRSKIDSTFVWGVNVYARGSLHSAKDQPDHNEPTWLGRLPTGTASGLE